MQQAGGGFSPDATACFADHCSMARVPKALVEGHNDV